MTPEEKIADLKANFDYILEGKDLEIKTLGERCNQLLKDKGELTDKIEKMKCCQNCAENDKYDFYDDTWHDDVCGDCENQCNWKLKE